MYTCMIQLKHYNANLVNISMADPEYIASFFPYLQLVWMCVLANNLKAINS